MPRDKAGHTITFLNRLEYALLKLVRCFFRVLPRAMSLRIARLLGAAGYYLLRGRRRVMLENLKIAFPHMWNSERRRTARRSFASFTAGVVENFRIDELDADPKRFFEYEDADIKRLWSLFDAGKGVIFVYFHYGNWELLTPLYAALKLPPSTAVARHIKNPLVTDFLTNTRTRDNLRIVFRGSAGREVLRAIKNGEGVGIPCDMNTTRPEGIFVKFFGVPAATTPAPAEISLRYGPPVVITFIERNHQGGYHVRFAPVIEPDDFKNEAEPVPAMMLAINRAIEDVIRRDPAQYLWGHRRWHTRPPGDPWKPRY